MSTKEEAMRSTSYTPMFSDDEPYSQYVAHRKYNEQEASPIPQDSSDPSTNVSPITTPCKSSLNDKHSSRMILSRFPLWNSTIRVNQEPGNESCETSSCLLGC